MKENYQKQLDALLAALPPEGKPRLLLQSCCGPCSSYVLEYLTRYFRVTVLYYNPNIQPRDEYDRRLYWQQELIRQLPRNNAFDSGKCHLSGSNGIGCAECVSLNAWHFNKPGNRIANQAQHIFKRNGGSV